MAGETVLVVDDNRSIVAIVDHFLTASGFKVLPAAGPAEALEFLAGIVPDVLLFDVMMPQTTGLELALLVKKNPDLARVPVIFLSARRSPEAKRAAKDAGGIMYLEKPFKKDDLLKAVRIALAAKRGGSASPPAAPESGGPFQWPPD